MTVRTHANSLTALLLGAGLFLLPSVQATAGMVGSDLGWQFYGAGFSYNPSDAGTETSGSFIVANDAVGGTFIEPTQDGLEDVFNINSNDTSITFDYSVNTASGPWSDPPINGPFPISTGVGFDLLSGSAFTNVTIDPSTNMTGFTAADLSFTANSINVDFAGLAFNSDTIVKLDVTTGDGVIATPEPSAGSLMLLSVLACGLCVVLRTRPE